MTTAIDTRSPARRLRTHRFQDLVPAPSRTRGPSPTRTEFRDAVRRLFRAPFGERSARADAVARDIRASRYPDDCVNVLLDEAVNRGGHDGLELAARILAKVPASLERVIDSLFANDSGRRKADRKLGHPRYRATDEIWGVLLDALARTDPAAVSTRAVLDTFRRVERSATAGMRTGIAAGVAELADRGPTERKRAAALFARMRGRPADGRELTAATRAVIDAYLADPSD